MEKKDTERLLRRNIKHRGIDDDKIVHISEKVRPLAFSLNVQQCNYQLLFLEESIMGSI